MDVPGIVAAVNNLPVTMSANGVAESSKALEAAIPKATGEMVAVSQATGKVIRADKLPSSPYGAATVTNDVVPSLSESQHARIIAYKPGATGGKLPYTAGPQPISRGITMNRLNGR